eukprot:gene4599-6027_t
MAVQQAAAHVMAEFQQLDAAWTQADAIVARSSRIEAKFLALKALDQTIERRWNLLTAEQRLGVRNFVINTCVGLSNSPADLVRNRMLLEKLNFTLVQVLKKEWPESWPTFISDIVQSSVGNDSLMQNNLAILRQLSEEIFDFSKGKVFEMIAFVLQSKSDERLLVECLRCLERFLGWIPLGYIFEPHGTFAGQRLVEILTTKFLLVPVTRNAACRCLTEIGSLASDESTQPYNEQFAKMFVAFLQQLCAIIPPAHMHLMQKFVEQGDAHEQFVANATQFFVGFFRQHLQLVETGAISPGVPAADRELAQTALHQAHLFLVGVTGVDEKEIFKAAVEHWQWLAEDVHKSLVQVGGAAPVGQAGQS